MFVRRIPVVFPRVFRALRILLDVGVLCGLWWFAAMVDRRLGLTIPAGVMGMGILFLLLVTGLVPVRRVKRGADWLLAEMLLFFVPACVGIVRYFSVLATYGVRLLVVIVVGTVCVMVCTALAVDGVYRIERRIKARNLMRQRIARRGDGLGFEGVA